MAPQGTQEHKKHPRFRKRKRYRSDDHAHIQQTYVEVCAYVCARHTAAVQPDRCRTSSPILSKTKYDSISPPIVLEACRGLLCTRVPVTLHPYCCCYMMLDAAALVSYVHSFRLHIPAATGIGLQRTSLGFVQVESIPLVTKCAESAGPSHEAPCRVGSMDRVDRAR